MSSQSSSPAPAHTLDDENLLEEILLHLPTKPSALPCTSLVCKAWRNILSDCQFLGRFRKHHRKPPLLGFFTGSLGAEYHFFPVLDQPDRIAAAPFSLPHSYHHCHRWGFMGCRHGLAILVNDYLSEVTVWDPLTNQQHRIPYPSPSGHCNTIRETIMVLHAAFMCVNAEDGHVHGDCFSSPFKVVLICDGAHTSAWLYESVSCAWQQVSSTTRKCGVIRIRPSTLIGNSLCWLSYASDILAFDIEKQSLEVFEKPTNIHDTNCWSFQVLQTKDNSGLHLAVMSNLSIQLWKRKTSSNGFVGWVLLKKIIHLEGLLPQGLPSNHQRAVMVGYDEESNVIGLTTYTGEFMLEVESMRFKRISESRNCWSSYKVHYRYRNFYTPGRGADKLLEVQKDHVRN